MDQLYNFSLILKLISSKPIALPRAPASLGEFYFVLYIILRSMSRKIETVS
jgi:hypothetical protein